MSRYYTYSVAAINSVAPADVSSGKTTCRPGGNECASPTVTPKTTPKVTPAPTTKQTPAPTTKSTPATTTKATPAPTGKGIPDWTTCQHGVDTCASSGWVCCFAPADLSSGKATCRPGGNECASTSTTLSPPPPSSGNWLCWSQQLLPAYFDGA
ncbi:hypothetical protein AC1031_011439 [Aphanomyces cochlioides]|nr:hypothetical protein AC1031_011439 [Aphanomyces cochlioides]